MSLHINELYEQFLRQIPSLIEGTRLRINEPLSEHCSFKIGGPADLFAEPNSETELVQLLKLAITQHIPYFVLGKGSNLLISDKGMRALVISTDHLTKISRDDHCISAYAGVLLEDLCNFALDAGLSGLEFASGIPGSVGGAVFMNAGAYGGEIKDVLYNCRCLKPELEQLARKNPITYLKNADLALSYRHSILQDTDYILVSSVFQLKPDDPALISERMQDLHRQRWEKQPMELPSGGSVFKRPEGHFTGKLIDDCGLRGHRIGDAAISEKHCGFIVNLGKATSQDVLNLIKYVQQSVFDSFGVILEPELRLVGEI